MRLCGGFPGTFWVRKEKDSAGKGLGLKNKAKILLMHEVQAKGQKLLHVPWFTDREDTVKGFTQAIHKLHMEL